MTAPKRTPPPAAHNATVLRAQQLGVQPPIRRLPTLTAADIALILDVSKMTVYRLLHSGEIRSLRVGHSFRILERDFNAWFSTASDWNER